MTKWEWWKRYAKGQAGGMLGVCGVLAFLYLLGQLHDAGAWIGTWLAG